MEELELEVLYNYYHRKLQAVSTTFKRYLYNRINWNARLIGLMGARGVGKTTMLLQRIKETFPNIDDALYISLDDLWFKSHSLLELAEYADTHNINYLFIDEVHRYQNWAQSLKTIYDAYPNMHIVYTSSSMLEVDHSKGDLSRRQSVYHLQGLSFREYLVFEGYSDIPCPTIEQLLASHVSIAMQLTGRMKVLQLFEQYCHHGFYPFYKETGEDYHNRLQEVVRTVIDVDLAAVAGVTYTTLQKAKTLLMIIAENVPMVPNLSALFFQIETTRDVGLKLLNLLERADLLLLLSSKPKNYKNLKLPEKIYLNNGNEMYALTPRVNIGCLRETFFLNQLRCSHEVSMPNQGDFLVDGKHLFEVGGKGKSFSQIADIANSYLALDNIETGHGNCIPLWMFGLLY